MGLDETVEAGMVEVLNKADLLSDEERETLANRVARSNNTEVLLSAQTGEGCERLLDVVEARVKRSWTLIDVVLGPQEGALLSWLYDHGHVVERSDEPEGIRLKVNLDPANRARFERMRASAAKGKAH
jgi:GTP-binding protein HflX